MSEKFTYEVRPKVPMRNFIPGKMINRPTVLQLDMEEVKAALKFGPVYRRFDTTHVERVTLVNLEELHRDSYINVAPNKIIMVEEKEEITLANVDELNRSSYINVAPNNIIEASIEEAPSEDSTVDNDSIENASIEEVVSDEEDPTNNASIEEVVEEEVEESVEDNAPEAPVNEDLGSEESVESFEEDNEIEETGNAEESATEQNSNNSNTNVYHGHKKRRHH